MSYCLYKLSFSTPLHIGDSSSARSLETSSIQICADTLFSALCHMARLKEGVSGIDKLVKWAKDDRLLFGDCLPYKDDQLYLPKPFMLSRYYDRAKTVIFNRGEQKRMKALKYIPLDSYEAYCAYLRGEQAFKSQYIDCDFGHSYVEVKAAIQGQDETKPYHVGLFDFASNCGLWFLLLYENETIKDYVTGLLAMLGYTGIGGKVSAGYGKFSLNACLMIDEAHEDTKVLFRYLRPNKSARYMSITTSLPTENEMPLVLSGSGYGLVRRGGFVQSADYGGAAKKATQYFLAAGSSFEREYKGDVYNVSLQGNHPVWRYGKPLFLRVNCS